MFKVGLTGGIASGKSTVSHLFTALGIPVIDADTIAHDLVKIDQPCYKQIVSHFGTDILLTNLEINRPKLRQLIFQDQEAKLALESILHPAIREELSLQSQTAKSSYCILAIPLLIEANMTDLVNKILVIDTTPELQLSRLINRDNIDEEQAIKMIRSQFSREQRLKYADDVIVNEGSPDFLEKQVLKLHKYYCDLANLMSNSCQPRDSHGQ